MSSVTAAPAVRFCSCSQYLPFSLLLQTFFFFVFSSWPDPAICLQYLPRLSFLSILIGGQALEIVLKPNKQIHRKSIILFLLYFIIFFWMIRCKTKWIRAQRTLDAWRLTTIGFSAYSHSFLLSACRCIYLKLFAKNNSLNLLCNVSISPGDTAVQPNYLTTIFCIPSWTDKGWDDKM